MLNLHHQHNNPSHEGGPHTLGPTLMWGIVVWLLWWCCVWIKSLFSVPTKNRSYIYSMRKTCNQMDGDAPYSSTNLRHVNAYKSNTHTHTRSYVVLLWVCNPSCEFRFSPRSVSSALQEGWAGMDPTGAKCQIWLTFLFFFLLVWYP